MFKQVEQSVSCWKNINLLVRAPHLASGSSTATTRDRQKCRVSFILSFYSPADWHRIAHPSLGSLGNVLDIMTKESNSNKVLLADNFPSKAFLLIEHLTDASPKGTSAAATCMHGRRVSIKPARSSWCLAFERGQRAVAARQFGHTACW